MPQVDDGWQAGIGDWLDLEQADLGHVIRATSARSWMNGRHWINDPDTLVGRPEIAEREEWAAHLGSYGGLAFSSDRLAALDERGLELTRRVLSSPQVPP